MRMKMTGRIWGIIRIRAKRGRIRKSGKNRVNG